MQWPRLSPVIWSMTFWPSTSGSGDSSVGRASDWKSRRNTDAGSSPRCGKGFFSQCQLSVQTLLRCPYSPCVLSYASASVQTLKTANFGGITMNGQREILQTLIGMGSAALAAAVFFSQVRRPESPTRDQEVQTQISRNFKLDVPMSLVTSVVTQRIINIDCVHYWLFWFGCDCWMRHTQSCELDSY